MRKNYKYKKNQKEYKNISNNYIKGYYNKIIH